MLFIVLLVIVKIRIGGIFERDWKGEINPSGDLTLLVSPGEFRITENDPSIQHENLTDHCPSVLDT